MLYLMLFSVCIAVELSQKIHTDNILKKIAIGFIAVGALAAYDGHYTPFITIGILVYLAANLFTAYCFKPRRRKVDQ